MTVVSLAEGPQVKLGGHSVEGDAAGKAQTPEGNAGLTLCLLQEVSILAQRDTDCILQRAITDRHARSDECVAS